jgi:hypothetical protein
LRVPKIHHPSGSCVSTDDSGQLAFSGRSQTPDLHRRDTFGCQQVRSSILTTSPDWTHSRRPGDYPPPAWEVAGNLRDWSLFALLTQTAAWAMLEASESGKLVTHHLRAQPWDHPRARSAGGTVGLRSELCSSV